jgi:hypothetical protein
MCWREGGGGKEVKKYFEGHFHFFKSKKHAEHDERFGETKFLQDSICKDSTAADSQGLQFAGEIRN